MPIAVQIQDGDAVNGSSTIDIACWPVKLERADSVLNITAYDGAKWLERRSAARVSSTPQPAGAHFIDLFSNVIEDREERPAYYYVPGFTPGYGSDLSAWPYSAPVLSDIRWGYQWVGAAAVDNSHSASFRQATFGVRPYTTASDPTSVKLRIFTYEIPGVDWSNTIEVSVDNGSTWDAAHTIPAQSQTHETWIDLTGDHSWVAADLASIQVRCTVEADADYAGTWNVDEHDSSNHRRRICIWTAHTGASTLSPSVVTLPPMLPMRGR